MKTFYGIFKLTRGNNFSFLLFYLALYSDCKECVGTCQCSHEKLCIMFANFNKNEIPNVESKASPYITLPFILVFPFDFTKNAEWFIQNESFSHRSTKYGNHMTNTHHDIYSPFFFISPSFELCRFRLKKILPLTWKRLISETCFIWCEHWFNSVMRSSQV